MFSLHDDRDRLMGLNPLVVRACKYPRAGLQIELHGVYAAFGIDPLDVRQYPRLLALKDLVREHLFESKSPQHESLLGQYWAGTKYVRAAYQYELPRVDASVDFGARYYTFATGPQMVKNAGPESELKDRLIVKVFNAPGYWLVELKSFSRYLQERGLATAHPQNAVAFEPLALPQRLWHLLHSVEPSIVLAAQRSAQLHLAQANQPEMLSWVDKDNRVVLEDLAMSVGAPLTAVVQLIEPLIQESAQLKAHSRWSKIHHDDALALSSDSEEASYQPLAA